MDNRHAYRESWRPVAGIVAVAVALICLVILFNQVRATFDPDLRAQQEAAYWRQQQIDQQTYWADLASAVVTKLTLPVSIALLGIGAPIVGLLIAYRRWAWREMVKMYYEAKKVQAEVRQFGDNVQTVSLTDSRKLLPPPEQEDVEPPAHQLSLPDAAPLSELIEQIPKGQLAYGILPDDKPLMLPMAAGYHILAHGDIRSGKTNFLDGLLVQLHHKSRHYDLRLIAGDFKRELAATWSRSPLLEAVETDPTAIAEMLEELVSGRDGVLSRYAEYQRIGERDGRIIRNIGDWCKVTGQRPRLAFVCVDELNAVLEAADRKANLSGALKVALQTGAGAGLFIMGGAQYLNGKTFGRDGSKQFVTRCHFGAWDPVAIRTMFGEKIAEDVRPLLTAQAGRGLIRTAGQSMPSPFQALRCDESDIIGAIRLLTDDQPTVEIPETLKPQRNAYETPETGFRIAPEIAQIVRRLQSEGKGKKEIVSLIWGAKPGGSDSYKQASAAYDAIVAERPA